MVALQEHNDKISIFFFFFLVFWFCVQREGKMHLIVLRSSWELPEMWKQNISKDLRFSCGRGWTSLKPLHSFQHYNSVIPLEICFLNKGCDKSASNVSKILDVLPLACYIEFQVIFLSGLYLSLFVKWNNNLYSASRDFEKIK